MRCSSILFWSIYGLCRSSDSCCTWTRWAQRRNPIFRLHIHTNISFASVRCSVKGNSNPLRVETGCNKPFPSYAFHICVWNDFFSVSKETRVKKVVQLLLKIKVLLSSPERSTHSRRRHQLEICFNHLYVQFERSVKQCRDAIQQSTVVQNIHSNCKEKHCKRLKPSHFKIGYEKVVVVVVVVLRPFELGQRGCVSLAVALENGTRKIVLFQWNDPYEQWLHCHLEFLHFST